MVRFAGLLFLLLALIGPVLLPTPVLALDNASLEQGEQIFSSNCAACHMGGGNVIRANRSLTIRDLNAHLEEYQQDPLEAIEHQIEAGKNAMPSYEGKLSIRAARLGTAAMAGCWLRGTPARPRIPCSPRNSPTRTVG